jgi:hypothetical protein
VAALTSRSWLAPQGHVHSRTSSGIDAASRPHVEHSFDDGNQRSTTTSVRPYQAALYSSMVRSCAPGRVGDGAGEAVVGEHVAHAEVFDHDRLVITDESSRQLVQMISAPVGDAGMDTGHLEPGLGPVGRALLLTAQGPLGLGELAPVVDGLATWAPDEPEAYVDHGKTLAETGYLRTVL